MKTIIVPIDFSTASDKACKYALELAKDIKAKVILIHAFESSVLYSQIPLMTVQADYSNLYNIAAHKLKSYYKKISKYAGKVQIDLNIQPGLASARITELAIERKADMIVMGTTGKGAVGRVLMGSNTTRTIRSAPCLVLAIPPRSTYNGFRKIVYTTDLSTENLKHVNRLIPFCKIFGSEIIFLNVEIVEMDDKKVDLKKIKDKIKKTVNYSKISAFVATDTNVAEGVGSFLKYNKADCLAVYTHHRNMFTSLFNKSIAKALSIHTHIPLLVIHESDYDENVN